MHKNLLSIILSACMVYSGGVPAPAFNTSLAVPGECEVLVTRVRPGDIQEERASLDRIHDLYKVMHETEFMNFSMLLPEDVDKEHEKTKKVKNIKEKTDKAVKQPH